MREAQKSKLQKSKARSGPGSLSGSHSGSDVRHSRALKAIVPDQSWIQERRGLVKKLRGEVTARLGPEAPSLQRFRERYERELRGLWKISDKDSLIAEIEQASLVYGGDFHALGHAQRTHLKILRALRTSRPVVLALECFSRSAQMWIDAYLKGSCDLQELKERAKWDEAWGFPWENYAPLLELAKRRRYSVVGLNEGAGSSLHARLTAREASAATKIAQVLSDQPETLIYVLFGDLHLASPHLPQKVRRALSKKKRGFKPREVVVHLNSEKIYFQLAKLGQELTVDVVRFAPVSKSARVPTISSFCVLSSPPWVLWQAYLLFLDRDVEAFYDPTDQVALLIRLAAKDIGATFKVDDLSVSLVGNENKISLPASLKRRLPAREQKVAKLLLARGQSVFFPAQSLACLAEPTVNHAASLAGQYIHARLARRTRALWDLPVDFNALIWIDATAYFFSKVINHKRQSETLPDLQRDLRATSNPAVKKEALRLALDHRMSELVYLKEKRRRPLRVKPRQTSSYYEAARILGGLLGERLYMAFRSRKLTANALCEFLKFSVTDASFQVRYEKIVERLSQTEVLGVRDRRERL